MKRHEKPPHPDGRSGAGAVESGCGGLTSTGIDSPISPETQAVLNGEQRTAPDGSVWSVDFILQEDGRPVLAGGDIGLLIESLNRHLRDGRGRRL